MDIASLATAPLVLSTSVHGPAKEPVLASYSPAMERFNAIMNAVDPVRQHEEVFSAVPTNTVSRVSVGDVPTGTETLGNQILATLNSASNQYTAAWNDTKLRLERVSRQESMVDMLRLQSDMLLMSVQYELVGKVVARSTQNIDTLVRMS